MRWIYPWKSISFFFLILTSPLGWADSNKSPLISNSSLPVELSNTIIHSMYRDSSGFLWIGTQSGFITFDGHKLTTYSSEQSGQYWIPANDIRGFAEDELGRLYIATFGGGLLELDRNTNTITSITKFGETEARYISRMQKSDNGSIWISTYEGVILFDPSNYQSRSWILPKKQGTKLSGTIAILEIDAGNLLASSYGSLWMVSEERRNPLSIPINDNRLPEYFDVTSMYKFDDSSILVGTDTGHVVHINVRSGKVINVSASLPRHPLVMDFLLLDGKILIATDRGLFISNYDLSEMNNISRAGQGLSSNDVSVLYRAEHYVWVGTMDGLNILTFTPIGLHHVSSGSIRGEVQAFEEDNVGNFWIGTFDGLYRYNPHWGQDGIKLAHSQAQVELRNQRITSLERAQDDLLVGYLVGGVESFSLSNGIIQSGKPIGEEGWSVVDILYDNINNKLWVATFGQGLFSISNDYQSVTSYLREGWLEEYNVTMLHELSSSRLLVACIDKLYLYDLTQGSFETLPFFFEGSKSLPVVYSAIELTSGDIWIGTSNQGVFVWSNIDQTKRRYHAKRFADADVLLGRTIYSMQQDAEGYVWLSTNRGILKLDSGGRTIRQFTLSDGLQHTDFSLGASFKSSDGRIFFGGPGGYNVIHPEELTEEPTPPQTVLTSVRFTSSTHHPAMRITDDTAVQLTHRDRFITFSFSVMDFFASGSSQYKYTLDGFDDGWVDNGFEHSATYTNLPSGEYVFHVIGRNSAGLWDPTGASVSVNVLPPPWRTGWAYLAYGIIALILGWVAHRVYHSYVIERRAREMVREMYDAEMRAEEDMQEQIEYQDEIMQAAYQHKRETLNLVGAILSGARTPEATCAKPPEGEDGLKGLEVLSLVEGHVRYRPEGPSINLHDFVEAIIPDLMPICTVDTDTVVVVNEIPRELIPSEVASPLAVILYELLKNCFAHAFEQESPANFIVVRLVETGSEEQATSNFVLTVRDSGAGQSGSDLEYPEPGSGLAMVNSIVAELSGTLTIEIDEGTCVSVSLPAQN